MTDGDMGPSGWVANFDCAHPTFNPVLIPGTLCMYALVILMHVRTG